MLFVDSQVVYQVDFSNIFERIEFLGTTHVDPYSIERVKKRIEEVKPSLIALELDYKIQPPFEPTRSKHPHFFNRFKKYS